MHMVYQINTDGKVDSWAQEILPFFDEMRAFIGCRTLEHVNVFFQGQPATLYVDEDGLSKELPFNAKASRIYANVTLRMCGHKTYDDLTKKPPRGVVAVGDRVLAVVGKAVLVQRVPRC